MRVTVADMMAAREARAQMQLALLMRYPGAALVCLTMNVAGPVKTDAQIERAFSWGKAGIEAVLAPQKRLFFAEIHEATGPEAVYAVEGDAREIKRRLCGYARADADGALYGRRSLKPPEARKGFGGTEARRPLCGMKAGGTSGNGKERLRDYSVSRSGIPQRPPMRSQKKRRSNSHRRRRFRPIPSGYGGGSPNVLQKTNQQAQRPFPALSLPQERCGKGRFACAVSFSAGLRRLVTLTPRSKRTARSASRRRCARSPPCSASGTCPGGSRGRSGARSRCSGSDGTVRDSADPA